MKPDITEAEKWEGIALHSQAALAHQALNAAKERLAAFNARMDRKYKLAPEDQIDLAARTIVRLPVAEGGSAA